MPHVLLLLLLGILCTTIQADESTESPESPEVTVNTVSSAEGECAHRADDNDRLYIYYTGIDHNTGEIFDTNRGLGDSALIMRVGEPNLLHSFQESLLGACGGDKLFIAIPASKNNDTLPDGRVNNMPFAQPIDFEVEIILIVPHKAIAVTDKLLLNMRKTTDVSSKDVEEAIELGMPVDVVDTNGRSLLVTAAFTANKEAVFTLLKHYADPNKLMHTGMSALIYASGEGHVEILRALLKHGAKTDAHLHLHGSSLQGYTALHFACLQGRTDSVQLLLEYGADPSVKDSKGLSPLATARSILIDGAPHKGLKPRDRTRGRKEYPKIKKLILNALIEQQQRNMESESGDDAEKKEL